MRSYRTTYTQPKGNVDAWKVIKSLFPYLLEFRWRVVAAMVLLVFAKLASVYLPLALKYIIDDLEQVSREDMITVIVAIPLGWLVIYGLLRFGSTFFGELRDAVFARVSERTQRRVSLQVFKHLHQLDLSFHLRRRTGGLARDIERGTTGISFLLRFLVFNIVPTLFELALITVILFTTLSWIYALTVVISVICYIGFSVVVTEWRTGFVREANERDNQSNTQAVDSLLNFETVKYFNNEQYETERYDQGLSQWEQARLKNRLSLVFLNSGQALIIAAGITIMMIMAAQDVSQQKLTLGDFAMVNAYMIQLFVPLNFLGFVYREIKQALASIENLFSLLKTPSQVTDVAQADTLKLTHADICFEHVSFAYAVDASPTDSDSTATTRPILHDVSFNIPAGHKVALVGPSGSGKSTIARLLFRFYDLQTGRILIDGQDISQYTQDSVRAAIGVVPQDTVLFNDTIEYNLRYGHPEASDEQLQQVIEQAQLGQFIQHLPQGLKTMVGERGLKLSGGEKQRVAIARALLKNPPIMIFDEATASLDTQAERHIQDALTQAMQQRTTLVIAHRLSTITDADEILVLEQGRVVQQGKHDELIEQPGLYQDLWQQQASLQAHEAISPDEVAVLSHPRQPSLVTEPTS